MHAARRTAIILPVVLVLIGLLAVIMAGFMFFVRAEVSGVQAQRDAQQARLAAESGLEEVLTVLRASRDDPTAWFDNPDRFRHALVWAENFTRDDDPVKKMGSRKDILALPAPPVAWRYSVVARNDDGPLQTIRYGVTPEAGKLNLNSATDAELERLLIPLLLDLGIENAQELVACLEDWRDDDSDTRPGGAEDDYYTNLQPGYHCKNAPLDTLEELLLVKGWTAAAIYGEDTNRNGLLDRNEDDGEASFPSYDNGNNVLDSGIAPFVTVWSREPKPAGGAPAAPGGAQPGAQQTPGETPQEGAPPGAPAGMQPGTGAPAPGTINPPGNQAPGFSPKGSAPPAGSTPGAPGKPGVSPFTPPGGPSTPAALPPIKPGQGPAGPGPTSPPPPAAPPAGTSGGKDEKKRARQQSKSPPAADPNQQAADIAGQLADLMNGSEGDPNATGEEQTPAGQTPAGGTPQGGAGSQDQTRAGLIDVNTAPLRVLQALDGMPPEVAEAIVTIRKEQSGDALKTPDWLVSSGAMDGGTYALMKDKLTTQSLQFHVEIIGYGDHTKLAQRHEWIVEMRGSIAQVLYHRDLTSLGLAWPLDNDQYVVLHR